LSLAVILKVGVVSYEGWAANACQELLQGKVELAIKGAVDIRLEINVAVWVLSAGGKRPSEVGIRLRGRHTKVAACTGQSRVGVLAFRRTSCRPTYVP
jgi:hypothetical protein